MSIVCSVDYGTAQKYKGKNLSAKYNNKKHRVYLKLHADDSNLQDCIELAKQSRNILMVSYQGMGSWEEYGFLNGARGVYVGCPMDFGVDVSEADIQRAIEEIPESVTPIVNLPRSYTDLEFLWRVSKAYPRVRFSGGTLFAVDGLRVGEIGVDVLQKAEVKFGADSYRLRSGVDALENVSISTLEIDMTGKADTPKASKPKSTGTPKKKTDNIRSRIGSLFLNSDLGGL